MELKTGPVALQDLMSEKVLKGANRTEIAPNDQNQVILTILIIWTLLDHFGTLHWQSMLTYAIGSPNFVIFGCASHKRHHLSKIKLMITWMRNQLSLHRSSSLMASIQEVVRFLRSRTRFSFEGSSPSIWQRPDQNGKMMS